MKPLTQGVHHLGLTVSRLEQSAKFFVDVLGWSIIKRKPEYPAIFVSDGQTMLTLWATTTNQTNDFNRKTNVGLHHLALQVASEDDLQQLYQQLVTANISIEFAPEWVQQGPAKHLMCHDPSGIRIEFIWPGV